ncbi:MAG TPA: hypothetical protein VMV51_05450 [Gemmatimonadaceae bacterium]|nr:hypothetical protein [Gemmatimonadaceae bacterium]
MGAFVPTGAQADNFKSAVLVGGQLAFEMSDYFHVLGQVSWAPSREKFVTLGNHTADIYQYDAGVEFNALHRMSHDWLWRPFVGLGAGARTYVHSWNVSNSTCAAGYGTLGTEFQRGIYALRFEARNNVSCFESPVTENKKTVNDLGFSIGLAYHFSMR